MSDKGFKAMVPRKNSPRRAMGSDKNIGAPDLKDVGPRKDFSKNTVDVESMKAEAEKRRIDMISSHIQRIQDQIDSKKPGDPSIDILKKILDNMKEKLLEDNTEEEKDE